VLGVASVVPITPEPPVNAPAAESASEPEMTPVTMWIIDGFNGSDGELALVDGVWQSRGGCSFPTLKDVSDPRLGGRMTYCWDYNGVDGNEIGTASYRIENDDGAWQGSSVWYRPGGYFGELGAVVLVGEDAYEGLYAWLDASSKEELRSGVIFNVPPPEAPVPPDLAG
jgi:hypothetical protein